MIDPACVQITPQQFQRTPQPCPYGRRWQFEYCANLGRVHACVETQRDDPAQIGWQRHDRLTHIQRVGVL